MQTETARNCQRIKSCDVFHVWVAVLLFIVGQSELSLISDCVGCCINYGRVICRLEK